MNGKTCRYLDLAAIEAVGAMLLDPRPAFAIGSDGTRFLWANVAGAGLFGERHIGDLLARRLSALNPVTIQVARLARSLPADRPRLEILRIGLGVRLAALAAACRRLHLADGTSAVLAIGAGAARPESVHTRAERLAEAIAGNDRLVAVLDADGKVLGASGGFDRRAAADRAIDQLIEAATKSDTRLAKVPLTIGADQRPAGAVRFTDDGREYTLLVVGPPDQPRPVAEAETGARAVPPETLPGPLPETLPGPPEEVPATAEAPAVRPAPVTRFVWRTDAGGRFTVVSPELAEAVGAGNAALAGKRWETVAEVLEIDRDGRIGAALKGAASWNATVHWPVEKAGERIAIDLSAVPVGDRGSAAAGFRGFGVIRADDRRRDERAEPIGLADVAAAGETDAGRAAGPTIEPAPPPRPETADDLDNAARRSVEEGRATTPAGAAQHPGPAPSNVVRLPGAQPAPAAPDRLSGSERDAFRRIAAALGTEERESGSGTSGKATASAADQADAARADATGRAPAADFDAGLLDRLPIGVIVFREHKTLFANRALIALVGYDSFDGLVAAGGVAAIFPDGNGGWSGDKLGESGGELAARRRDGGTVPVEAKLHAVSWQAATALMLTISPRPARAGDGEEDLAEKLAAAEIRVGELSAILDTATDGVIVIDGSGKIGSMNRAAEALFGVEATDYAGRYFTDLLAEESRKPALDYLDGLVANGVASVLNDGREVIGSVPNGGLIPLFMTMGRIGGSDRFCAVLRDITHWKNVEGELVAARRAAEAANAQKSDFLAKMSHEIRTPLNVIIGFSEVMIEERFGPIGNERYRSYLRDIHVSGEHLMSLINDLLDLSKIEAGKLDLSFDSVPVNAVIQESVALMQPLANRERIIIRTSLAGEVPDIVADLRSFRQILLNLMSNAIKFTKAGGQVIVSSALEATGEVVIRIRDTGIGMSEKDVDTAMKPFRQVAAAGAGRDKGTGLGLPLTKAMVEANRARFAIESAPAQGTLIKITFPTTRVLAG